MTLPLIGTMNSLDLFVLGFLVLFAGLGAWKGLVKTLFQMAAWAAGALGAWTSGQLITPLLIANIANLPPFGLTAFSGFLGFILCFVIVRLIGVILHRWVSNSPLSFANRIGGALVGMLKAGILCFLLLYLLFLLPVRGTLLALRDKSQVYNAWITLYEPVPLTHFSVPSLSLPKF
jgi:uncharacterized membrane protein required for colicin V production